MTQDQIYDLGKKEVDYDRQLAVAGKTAADTVLYFWMEGFKYHMTMTDVPLFDKAKEFVINHQQCSPSFFQRKLQIGYKAACALVKRMEDEGVCGPYNGSKAREVLIKKQ